MDFGRVGRNNEGQRSAATQLSCVACHRTLDASRFPWRDKRKGQRRKKCRDCQRKYHQEYHSAKRTAVRQEIQSWFTGCECGTCGESNVACLCAVDLLTCEVIDPARDQLTHADLMRFADAVAVLCLNCEAKLATYPMETRKLLVSQLDSMLAARDDIELDVPRADQPLTPTTHLPGSPEKIEVMRERYAQGYPVMHEGDTTQ